MNNVLDCVKITKFYKEKLVLDSLDFSVPKGKIYGLLGPNGCGKTTLNKLIAGLLVPDNGEIYIDGKLRSEETNRDISYLPERTYLSRGENVLKTVDLFSDFFDDFDRDLALGMLADLDIKPNVNLGTLSKGTQEKVQLVLVMSRNADLYILDEPLGGVDPATRDYILDTILSNFSEDATVIISTHLISDIERILDEVIFIDNGKIALYGECDELRQSQNGSIDEIFRRMFKC